MNQSNFKHVDYNWDDSKVPSDPVERLVYRSNCLGADQRITNTGGGNTSSKVAENDPLTGGEVDVLWVKGSGGDLRTSKRENFASLYMAGLENIKNVYGRHDKIGAKTAAEDAMVGHYPQVTFNLNPRASSIDTPLHAFIPARYVDHMHPNAVIAIAACADQETLIEQIWGGEVGYVGWQRPGFDLGLKMEVAAKGNPKLKGLLMGQHGIINWADEDKECYDLTLALIEKAADFLSKNDKGDKTFGGKKYDSLDATKRDETLVQILPWLRGQVSQQARFIGTVESRDAVMQFVNSHDAKRLAEIGTSCPDHFLRTKIKPLYVEWNPQTGDVESLKNLIADGLVKYRADYKEYYESCKHADSPAMRDPNPTVVLVPGLGMIAWGKNKSESRVTAEFYCCAVEVMKGAEAVSKYQGLPRQEAFDIEYWLLEEAKLQRMPKEKEMARKVVAVVGGGSGIGRETCSRLIPEGAEVVAVDLKKETADETATAIEKKIGKGIGVAGSGISGCGDVIGLAADITDAASVEAMLKQAILAYGGVDSMIVTAGYFATPDKLRRQHAAAVGREFQDQRDRPLQRRAGRVRRDEAAGARRHDRADDERERRRRQEGQLPLRHEQGGREPPDPRAGRRLRAVRPRQRRRPGDGRGRQQHVPARPRNLVAGEVRDSARRVGRRRRAARFARRVLRQADADQRAHHAGRPSRSVVPARRRPFEQDDRPGHQRRRRAARGVPAVAGRPAASRGATRAARWYVDVLRSARFPLGAAMTYSQPPAVPVEPPRAGGLAITALVLAIIAAVVALIPLLGLLGGLLAVVTLVLGIVSWATASGNPRRSKGVAVAATIVSVLAIVIAVVVSLVAVYFARPYLAKTQAVAPAFKSAAQASTAAENAGADKKAVSAAMQTFTEKFGNAIKDSASAAEAVQQADAALAALQDQLDALPKTAAAATLPADGTDPPPPQE